MSQEQKLYYDGLEDKLGKNWKFISLGPQPAKILGIHSSSGYLAYQISDDAADAYTDGRNPLFIESFFNAKGKEFLVREQYRIGEEEYLKIYMFGSLDTEMFINNPKTPTPDNPYRVRIETKSQDSQPLAYLKFGHGSLESVSFCPLYLGMERISNQLPPFMELDLTNNDPDKIISTTKLLLTNYPFSISISGDQTKGEALVKATNSPRGVNLDWHTEQLEDPSGEPLQPRFRANWRKKHSSKVKTIDAPTSFNWDDFIQLAYAPTRLNSTTQRLSAPWAQVFTKLDAKVIYR